MQKSESVPTQAKAVSVPKKREPTILHIDHTDLVLGVTSVFLSGFALGIIVVHL